VLVSTAACIAPALAGAACGDPVESGAPVPLCARHLLLVQEWSSSGSGVTDVLPSPCRACGSRAGIRYPSGWLCAVCEWRLDEVPDPDQPAVRVDVVYYLRFDDRVKIGTTANPRQRFGALRYDELLAFERGDRMLEQRRHAQFADHRLPGTEWFVTHPALEEHIDRVRAGAPDPWARLARWRSEAVALRG